jgi:23S rRNA (adenine1618-N6)-methyltransferase
MQNTAEFRRNRYRRKAIENCSTIIEANPKLVDFISLQQQTRLVLFFKKYHYTRRFAFTICPFHKSQEEATKVLRKVNNLESRDFE